jgi:hypothetical protein
LQIAEIYPSVHIAIALQPYLDTPDAKGISSVIAFKVSSFYSVDRGFRYAGKSTRDEGDYQEN